ncbi:sugar-binding transcriptional regulator [Ammoniphilus sp. YIM 78166]|uniref:sugar-binding transcriptional regulator n=1 Tax=Ammoniphilus sp. YIM 78166 TaxID=1644106 RepID=UPI00106FF28B|nr:sugar-binding domain-containing protein [Ammoniphilus sp. YIM 78166]
MREFLALQLRLVPDLVEVMQKRLSILRNIYLQQPIGRRSLAVSLHTTERILRAEVDFLKEQGLVQVESIGMFLTDTGLQILESLEGLIKDVYGLSDMESELQQRLKVNRVIVVPGQSSEVELDKKELGRAAANYLLSVLREQDIVAVTGGSTIATMAEMMSGNRQFPEVTFVPARGGLGENVELQANQIAANLAKKLGAQYRMFHISDNLSASVYQSIQSDPYISEMLDLIRSSQVVVHGIGRAVEMAIRRNAPSEVLKVLEQGKAVGEAFGYYFNKEGQIIHRMETMGLQLEDVKKARQVIGLAGGSNKAEAIYAIAKSGSINVLIIDESAAETVLKMEI